jgi:hypothetical protein
VLVSGIGIAVQTGIHALSWKKARARVIEASVGSRSDGDDGTFYFGVYRIRYEADGRTVESTIRSSVQLGSESTIRARVAARPPGTERTIFYNPAKPEQVQAEFGWESLALPCAVGGMGLIFLIVGGLVWGAAAGVVKV